MFYCHILLKWPPGILCNGSLPCAVPHILLQHYPISLISLSNIWIWDSNFSAGGLPQDSAIARNHLLGKITSWLMFKERNCCLKGKQFTWELFLIILSCHSEYLIFLMYLEYRGVKIMSLLNYKEGKMQPKDLLCHFGIATTTNTQLPIEDNVCIT